MLKRMVTCLMVCLAMSTSALVAAPVLNIPLGSGQYLDVAKFVGDESLPNEAYIVIDFSRSGGSSFAFGYRWSGEKTAHEALLTLVPEGLTLVTTGSGALIELNQLAYGGSSAGPYTFANDADFWSYWIGTHNLGSESISWEPSDYGISGKDFATEEVEQTLLNGEFYGFYVSTFPTVFSPPQVLPTSVPEPATWLLAATGLFVCLRAVRRRDSV